MARDISDLSGFPEECWRGVDESTTEKRGAYFAGAVFGIYVPLLDLN